MNSNFFQYRSHLWIVLAYWGKAIYAPLLIVNYYILNSTSVIIYHIVQVVHFLILKIFFRQLLESNHKTIHIWINCLYYCRQMVETDQHTLCPMIFWVNQIHLLHIFVVLLSPSFDLLYLYCVRRPTLQQYIPIPNRNFLHLNKKVILFMSKPHTFH